MLNRVIAIGVGLSERLDVDFGRRWWSRGRSRWSLNFYLFIRVIVILFGFNGRAVNFVLFGQQFFTIANAPRVLDHGRNRTLSLLTSTRCV